MLDSLVPSPPQYHRPAKEFGQPDFMLHTLGGGGDFAEQQRFSGGGGFFNVWQENIFVR